MTEPVLSEAVWDQYERDRPRSGRELNEWIARVSEESGAPPATIRKVIGQGAGAMLNAMNDRIQTLAQQFADVIGSGPGNRARDVA